MSTYRRVAFLLLVVLSAGAPARGQESRADAQREVREDKQRAASPYVPNALEKALKMAETRGLPFFTPRDGIYAKLGSLTTGSGFAYGGGFRTARLFAREGALDTWVGASLKGYWATEARLRFPQLADGRLSLEGYVRRHEYTQEDYFGLGPSSARDAQTDYSLRATMFGGRAAMRPARIVAIGGGLEYLQPRVRNGTDDALPSIGTTFDETTAPGLSAQTSYLRSIAFVDIDYRRPLNARRGGWYRAEWSHYSDRDLGAFAFNRFDLDLRQFVSVLAERRVFVARMFVSTSEPLAGNEVPFYLMPTLGGNDSLRGFRDYRYRGPHALLLQGEYRYEVWSGLDAALFYDAGKVAMHRGDLNFKNLESDYGVGFRFNTDNGIVVRVDAAFGSSDGQHLWIAFGGTF